MGLAHFQLETERLRIRPFTMEDAEAFYAILSEPEVFTYLPDEMPGLDEVRELIEWLGMRYQDDSTKHIKYTFAVTRKDTGELIGWCGLGDLDFAPDKKELYYGCGKEYWGKGYGTEAARAMVDTAFRVLGLPLLTAVVKPANVASVRIIEKCGFVQKGIVEGIEGEYAWYNGERYYEMDLAQYTIVSQAWQRSRKTE
jgi:ribosomal-protein-alanine N-acetyltransferase